MFGYVKVFQPELKMGEFEQYRGVYCSLCKQLGKRYGILSRMTLSYDFTFLAIFRMALDTGCTGFHKGRCLFNPLKKRLCSCENRHVVYAADAATLLMYYKLKDTIADSGFWKGFGARLLLPFAARARKKAVKQLPELDTVIASCMQEQAALEKEETPSIDRAAEPSAKMLSAMAESTARDEKERFILQRFGYCLGRWIYLVDAVDDLPEDLEDDNYNPYIISNRLQKGDEQKVKEVRQYALLTLNACLAECVAAYNLLDIHRFNGILRNILELGMPSVQKQVSEGKSPSRKEAEIVDIR